MQKKQVKKLALAKETVLAIANLDRACGGTGALGTCAVCSTDCSDYNSCNIYCNDEPIGP